MAGCCADECELEVLRERQSATLKVVFGINAVMFWATGSGWPDLVVASCLAVLFVRSAGRVLSAARAELSAAVPDPAVSRP